MRTQTFRPFRRGTNLDSGFLQRGQRLASNGYNIMSTSLDNHINRIVDPRGPFWNWIWLAVRIISTSLDPLFFYIFVVNDHKKCVDLDIKLAIIAISLRTIFDFFNIIYSSSTPHKHSRANAKKCFYLNSFLKDLLSCLPIPQVFGALWYFMAIERETECWKKACREHTECYQNSFHCYETVGNYTFLTGLCPTMIQDTTMFNFGMFQEAIQSGMVEEKAFKKKFIYCFRWGLQTVSCAGQNLQTSTHEGENLLASFIIIASLLLLLLVLGNLTIYLQSGTIKLEEIKSKAREIEQWRTFEMLSQSLQQRVRNHQQYVWQEMRGIDVENLLNNLPVNLNWEMKSELCLEVLKKVPMFQMMGKSILSEMCKCLKPVLYVQECCIVKEGDPICEMFFITQGTLLTTTTNGGRNTSVFKKYLSTGDFWGEELATSALDPDPLSNIPHSNCALISVTNVEAFAINTDDLRAIVYQYWQHRNHNMQPLDIFKFYSQEWRTSKACVIQAAWCRYKKRKLEGSLYAKENILQDQKAEAGGKPSKFGTAIYATQFFTYVRRSVKRNGGLPGGRVNITLAASETTRS
ncbi:Cyclic nucleotide-gated ion channel 1 [Citrus sinensis]|uniref:cyclic nucleotide-gated ion channel 1 isoform X4 n=1 Tax=Citrus sinensis TaxID=2711 RepID=UPI0003D7124C|nr:cyclic nucleotide-gated ion channel 1 isoform X4 [Citrus sinensis]XP_024039782.1 cyclic nucleotide-gated ion channel 1 isoform X3 [Citrus x clementina]KAH9646524.1 Cyclic nucleotide-gated ion channel 1 [Citrus sinensis]